MMRVVGLPSYLREALSAGWIVFQHLATPIIVSFFTLPDQPSQFYEQAKRNS